VSFEREHTAKGNIGKRATSKKSATANERGVPPGNDRAHDRPRNSNRRNHGLKNYEHLESRAHIANERVSHIEKRTKHQRVENRMVIAQGVVPVLQQGDELDDLPCRVVVDATWRQRDAIREPADREQDHAAETVRRRCPSENTHDSAARAFERKGLF
jgi:hypothetical protein